MLDFFFQLKVASKKYDTDFILGGFFFHKRIQVENKNLDFNIPEPLSPVVLQRKTNYILSL